MQMTTAVISFVEGLKIFFSKLGLFLSNTRHLETSANQLQTDLNNSA